jgi:hypothetical protein
MTANQMNAEPVKRDKNCIVQNNMICEPVEVDLFRGRENAPANTAGASFSF